MHFPDFIQTKTVRRTLLHRIHIYLITNLTYRGTSRIRIMLQIKMLVTIHRFFVHPYEHRLEIAPYFRHIVGMY